MSYLGNPLLSTQFPTDTLSGNGSSVNFTLSLAPASTSSIIVVVTGVTQDPSTYTISGTTLTFSAAPPSGSGNISVRHLGVLPVVNPTGYRFSFFKYDGSSLPINLLSGSSLPFFKNDGSSNNITLVS